MIGRVPELRPPRSAGWWIVPAALVVGAAVYAVARLLLTGLPSLTAAEVVTARNEAIRTALAAGAGVGAAITLMLGFRRQRHQEISVLISEHDGTERRVTDLYTKAVEQLGSEKAAVRLGGLYAMERLAQGDPAHRQTIVNVICAYLRMPYAPIGQAGGNMSPGPWLDKRAKAGADAGDREGERQVRLTGQRILIDHLRDDRSVDERARARSSPQHWEGMRLDLTGAFLIDFDFRGCHAAEALFERATFSGVAGFHGATFTGFAGFGDAAFLADAWLSHVTFTGNARFDRVTFSGDAGLSRTLFHKDAWFDGTTFSGDARFDETTFAGDAVFYGATFLGDAIFAEARFAEAAVFREAAFSGDAVFDRAAFAGRAGFGETTFAVTPTATDAYAHHSEAGHLWPPDWELTMRPDGIGDLRSRPSIPSLSPAPGASPDPSSDPSPDPPPEASPDQSPGLPNPVVRPPE